VTLRRLKQDHQSPGWRGQKPTPYLKENQRKRAGGVAQVVECLPKKHKALSTNTSTKKKKKKKGQLMSVLKNIFCVGVAQ
jgi:hypothetical protein